jgi:alpha-tubulin suppressor-like RCC1 family protein
MFSSNALALAFLLGVCAAGLTASAANKVVAWGAGTIYKPKDNNDFGQSIVPKTLTNAVQVAAGWRHTVALESTGYADGWGEGSLGDTNFPPIITTNPPATNFVPLNAVACGYLHTLGLTTNGLVYPIGDDEYGQINFPFDLSNVVAVAGGFYHSLALKSDGTVIACGATNSQAVLQGIGYGQSLVPPGLSNVVAIAGGGFHSLALKSDGTVIGWGRNDFLESTSPPGLSNVVAIAAGSVFSAVLQANGRVVAWGDNTYGQTNVPASLTNVVAVACGGWHVLALKSNGTVVAWGAGSGSNPNVDFKQNIVPLNLTNVIQIAAGSINSLALVGTNLPVIEVPLAIKNAGTNGFTLTVPTRNGRVYRLEYKNSLTDPAWNGLPLQAGTGATIQFIDPTPVAQRFYRVTRW